MKNFYQWMFNYSRKQLEKNERNYIKNFGEESKMGTAIASIDRGMSSDADLSFRMYKAENGHVMEVRHYDRRIDRNSNKLYLITDDQDLGAEISKIITIESLRS